MVGMMNPVFVRKRGIEQPQTPVTFQILSWHIEDVNDGDAIDPAEKVPQKTRLFLSGVDEAGRSVTAQVTGVTNYFLVDFPKTADFQTLTSEIKSRVKKNAVEIERAKFEVVERTVAYGFRPHAERFLKITFPSMLSFQKCKNLFIYDQERRKIKMNHEMPSHVFSVFETSVNPINRVTHMYDIPTAGWVTVSKYSVGETSAQVSIVTTGANIKPSQNESICDFTIASWDIECLPEDTEKFPDPSLENDQIVQISVVLHKFTSGTRQRFLICSRPCGPLKRASLIVTKSEKKLLEVFVRLMEISGFDFWIGYNNWRFDENFVWIRAQKLGVDLGRMSRLSLVGPKVTLKTMNLSSSAYGNNEYTTIDCPGSTSIDVMDIVRKEKKAELTYFGLNDVAMHYLKRGKEDLLPRQLFDYMASGDPDKVAICGDYCVTDSDTTLDVALKLTFLPNLIEMAKATCVPITWLLFRGQQCKVFSLILREAMGLNFIIPTLSKNSSEFEKSIEGATVLTQRSGMYIKPIVCVDFSSLYPSIIASLNLCHTTYIMDEETMCYVVENKIPYITESWIDNEDPANPVKITHSFVQYDDRDGNVYPNGRQGILRIILLKLWNGRNAAKKQMEALKNLPNPTPTDLLMIQVYNGKQLAYKITMNSVYGFTLPRHGLFPIRPVGETTTYKGRTMISATSSEINERFGGITIYGDSIPGFERVTVRTACDGTADGDKVTEPAVSALADSLVSSGHPWAEYRGFKVFDTEVSTKECIDTSGLGISVYTHQGFAELKKVIRHKTHKRLLRIRAVDDAGREHTVVVTEGHSLIAADGSLLAAEDARVGDKLFDYC